MKKLILIAFALLAAHILFAQPVKGKVYVGGNLNVNKTDAPTMFSNELFDKNVNLIISPNVGYFVSDKLAIGATINYGYYYYKNNSNVNSGGVAISMNGANYGGNLFARYYKPLTEKLFFTVNGSIGYSYTTIQTETFIKDSNNISSNYVKSKEQKNNYNINISPGFEYFVTPHLGLSTNIGSISYSFVQSKNQSVSKQSTNNFNINLFPFSFSSLSIGLKYYFNK